MKPNEPRSEVRSVYTRQPFNAGTPEDALGRTPLTPEGQFFVRSHADTPRIDPADYRLHVDGMVQTPLSLSLDDLRRGFPQVTLTATLQCAGFRRREMQALQAIDSELPWNLDAVSTAQWGGFRLADVLRAAGVDPAAGHIAFEGADHDQAKYAAGFGGSVPLEKALGDEVLLAATLNGAPLPAEHGFPLRSLVPGYIGARSVKWLTRITAQQQPSENYFQQRAYRLFPPDVRAETVDWDTGAMLGALRVNSAITAPQPGAHLPSGVALVQGFAIPGGAAGITRVELSADGGQRWQTAELLGEELRWSWRLWQAELHLTPGAHELVVRAFDSAGGEQPETLTALWNFKGYMNNAYHRVRIIVE